MQFCIVKIIQGSDWMEKILQALNEITTAISTTSFWDIAGVVVAGLALLGSLAVLYQNRKSIEISKVAIQKSIDLQMFDKMVQVANKIENNDYSSTTMEISTLFSKEILQQIEELRELTKQLSYSKRMRDKYYKLLEKTDYDRELYVYASEDDAPEEVKMRANEQEIKFQKLTEGEPDGEGGIIYYDIYEINEDIKNLTDEIKLRQKKVKNDVSHIIQDKYKVNEERKDKKMKASSDKNANEIMDIDNELKDYKKYYRGRSEKYHCYTEWEEHIKEILQPLKSEKDFENYRRYINNKYRKENVFKSLNIPILASVFLGAFTTYCLNIILTILTQNMSHNGHSLFFSAAVGIVSFALGFATFVVMSYFFRNNMKIHFYEDILEIVDKHQKTLTDNWEN